MTLTSQVGVTKAVTRDPVFANSYEQRKSNYIPERVQSDCLKYRHVDGHDFHGRPAQSFTEEGTEEHDREGFYVEDGHVAQHALRANLWPGSLNELTTVLRQGVEITSTMVFDQASKLFRSDHFDRITPLIEVPRHFEPSRCMKFDDEAAIRLVLRGLIWMEAKFTSALCCFRVKSPDDFSILFLILVNAERFGGVILQRETRGETEAFIQRFSA